MADCLSSLAITADSGENNAHNSADGSRDQNIPADQFSAGDRVADLVHKAFVIKKQVHNRNVVAIELSIKKITHGQTANPENDQIT